MSCKRKERGRECAIFQGHTGKQITCSKMFLRENTGDDVSRNSTANRVEHRPEPYENKDILFPNCRSTATHVIKHERSERKPHENVRGVQEKPNPKQTKK